MCVMEIISGRLGQWFSDNGCCQKINEGGGTSESRETSLKSRETERCAEAPVDDTGGVLSSYRKTFSVKRRVGNGGFAYYSRCPYT
jgi:hypothetical protein